MKITKILITIPIILSLFYCKKKSLNPELIIGRWIIHVSQEELNQLKTGRQKIFFLFNTDNSGLFYYYNIDYQTGNQYARKNKYFSYSLHHDHIEIKWKEDSVTNKWPYSLKENNKLLVISDPSPGGQTYVLERTTDE
jgi:hypothetical protein